MGTKKFLLKQKQLINSLPSYCNFMLNTKKKKTFLKCDLNYGVSNKILEKNHFLVTMLIKY